MQRRGPRPVPTTVEAGAPEIFFFFFFPGNGRVDVDEAGAELCTPSRPRNAPRVDEVPHTIRV